MVPFTTDPADCEIQYRCQQISSVSRNIDLCSYASPAGDSVASFDQLSGDYSFMTTDKTTFPPGEYVL